MQQAANLPDCRFWPGNFVSQVIFSFITNIKGLNCWWNQWNGDEKIGGHVWKIGLAFCGCRSS